ncbi:peptidoglycan-binding protein [Streptomyces sp. NPDC057575]|uniref:peptidoglycan-binding domain-containing protein n=1 Tax=unclassified Streptomyces TaxID=2593676 RepID=UPI0036836E1E
MKAAQAQLAGYGNRIAVDGAFGPATRNAAVAFQRSHGLTADGIIGPKTWNKLVNGTKTTQPAPTTPAPTTPAPSNGRLTQRQALTQLAAAGIKAPVGRTSLGGVRARTIQGVVALKKASGGCTIVITGGTESGHSTRGNHSHAGGYKLDLRTRDEGRIRFAAGPARGAPKRAGRRAVAAGACVVGRGEPPAPPQLVVYLL